jgi:hypothetical protein
MKQWGKQGIFVAGTGVFPSWELVRNEFSVISKGAWRGEKSLNDIVRAAAEMEVFFARGAGIFINIACRNDECDF